ncbi:unnamed protein product [Dracunculus medinensis]|uniref:Protein quiver n=1 Tax=Dracunculus medinensis TaxID=318479 RepID=A0A0N4U4F5_DRAME|nr:unnamed protein product [Dracunculus medinensis]
MRTWLILIMHNVCVHITVSTNLQFAINAERKQIFENTQTQLVPHSNTVRCLSCMSKFYEAVWPSLSAIYKRPKNFTDHCDTENVNINLIPITYCPTICVRMWEEAVVAGIRIKGNIRGCLSEILHNGFNQTIITWYRWMHRDSCRQYRKRELFKLSTEQSDESYVTVCTCYDDFCNAATRSNAPHRSLFMLFLFCFSIIITLLPVYRL